MTSTDARFDRLTATDLMYLRLETEDWPCHFAGLLVLEGSALLDGEGRLLLDEIARHLGDRLEAVPKLRRRLHEPGPMGGRPIWVDDDRFSLDHHLRVVAVDPPGGEEELLATACRLHGRLLDRSHPLWELWLITGLPDSRVGVLMKIHHSVADGVAALAVMASLFDGDSDAAVRPVSASVPTRRMLVADNLGSTMRRIWRAASALYRPRRIVSDVARLLRTTGHVFGSAAAPGSSLNVPVRAGRRVERLDFGLPEVKRTGRAHGGTVNDVVLALWAGGLGRLLAARSEQVDDVELVAAVPASLRTAPGSVDNQTGTIVVRLPIGRSDARARTRRIVESTTAAKREQRPATVMGYLAGLAGTPIGRWFTARQRASNVIVTNVAGPTDPVSLFGAPVLDIVPILQLVGNIGLTLCAFSYDGRISLVVTADASAFPDLDVLTDGMWREWESLNAD
jgi:diacylglycerol O-acyltransferase